MIRVLDLEEWKTVRDLAAGTIQPTQEEAATITKLPLKRITTRPSVFQPRAPLAEDNAQEREEHIEGLVQALTEGESLPPILIWKLKEEWVVLDGHHRLAAYQQVKQSSDRIPVRVFSGSFNQAVAQSIRSNRSDKLRMSRHEKENAAWKVVTEDTRFSLRQIGSIAGVSRSTVHRMTRLWKQLKEECPKRYENFRAIPYCQVRKHCSNAPTHVHWTKRRSIGIRNALSQGLGTYIRRWPELVAEEIASLYPQQAKALGEALMGPLTPVEHNDF